MGRSVQSLMSDDSRNLEQGPLGLGGGLKGLVANGGRLQFVLPENPCHRNGVRGRLDFLQPQLVQFIDELENVRELLLITDLLLLSEGELRQQGYFFDFFFGDHRKRLAIDWKNPLSVPAIFSSSPSSRKTP